MASSYVQRRARWTSAALVAPATAILGVFFLWPLVESVILAFRGGPDGLEALTSAPILRDFGFSFATSFAAAATSVLIAFMLVTVLHEAPPALKAVASVFALLPLLVPHIIAAYAIRLALTPAGPIMGVVLGDDAPNLLVTPASLIMALVWKLLPYAFLSAQASRMALAPELIEAARDLGATAWRRGTRILLPLMAPGLFAGGLLVFILSAAQYSITLVVYADKRTTTIPMDVFYLQQANQPGVGAALGLIFSILVVAVSIVGERISRRIGSYA